jgi:hypothetical protein
MTLLIPAPVWSRSFSNLPSTPSATVIGTSVVAGASNAEGTIVALGSALTFEAEYLVISVSAFAIAGANGSALLDIMIDSAGGTAWAATPLITDLLAGFTSAVSFGGTASPNGVGMKYHFPLRVPSGPALGARAKTAHTSTITGRVGIWAFGGNRNPGTWWAGNKVTAIGVDAANSIGVSHTPGGIGTYSSWTNFGSTAPTHAKAVQFSAQGTMSASSTPFTYHFEFGIGGQRIGPTFYKGLTSGESGFMQPDMPIFAMIPEGAQLQARATSNSLGEPIDIAAYLVS